MANELEVLEPMLWEQFAECQHQGFLAHHGQGHAFWQRLDAL
jgi:hypothetical protein